jgi:twinkle protein
VKTPPKPPTDSRRRTSSYRAPGYRHSIKDQREQPEERARPDTGGSERPSQFAPGEHTSSFLQHEPCPRCGSQDNLSRYDDGHAHCFTPGCDYRERGEGSPSVPAVAREKRTLPLLDGAPIPLPERHLFAATCSRFRYWAGLMDGERVEIANYFSADRQRVAQKIRRPGKLFHWRGEPSKALLFGQQLWQPGGRWVVVTEGEIDAMSVAQAFGLKWPVVSLPNGAGAAASAVRKQLEWLLLFEEVVFLLDQDEAGQNATEQCASLFPPGKARIATLPLKDPNEMLVAGQVGELVRAVWEAKEPER